MRNSWATNRRRWLLVRWLYLWTAMTTFAVNASMFVSFQQGDLRVVAALDTSTAGTLVNSNYSAPSTTLRSDQPNAAQNGSGGLLVGCSNAPVYRSMLAVDVSYLTHYQRNDSHMTLQQWEPTHAASSAVASVPDISSNYALVSNGMGVQRGALPSSNP